MFVDASALTALLTDADKAVPLATRLQAAPNRMTAPPCVLDAVARVTEATGVAPAAVFALVERFLEAAGIRMVSLPAALAAPAAALMARHGLSPNQSLCLAAARYYRLGLLHDDPALAPTEAGG